MKAKSTQSREGVKGGLRPFSSPPCRVKGQRPLWRLGQRPNCSSSNLLKGRSQAKSRQRSVPRPNFARPQTRPQAALSSVYAVSRRWRDRTACLSDMAACFRKQGFRACRRDQRALRSPSGLLRIRNLMLLAFFRSRSSAFRTREHHKSMCCI